MLVGSLNITLLVCLLHTPALLAIGAGRLAATTGFASGLLLLILWINQRWSAHRLCSHAQLLVAVVAILSGPLVAGGSFRASLPWMLVLPILAVMLVGRTAGLAWLVGITVINLLAWSLLDLASTATDPDLELMSALGLPVTVLGLTWTWEHSRVRAWRMQRELEQRLRESNEELARTQAMSRMVLDNVGHAMVLLGPRGDVASERSAAALRLLGELPVGRPVWEAFAADCPSFSNWIESSFLSADGGWVPLEHSLAQIPKAVRRGERLLEVEFRIVDRQSAASAVLLVATDVTDLRRAQAAEQTTREATLLLVQALENKHLVGSFMREGERLVDGLTNKEWPVADQRRAIHTLKGSSALMGLAQLAAWLHELEGSLDGGESGIAVEDAALLAEHWQAYRQVLAPIFGREEADDLVIHRFELDELIDRARRAGPAQGLLPHLLNLKLEPVAPRLSLLARQAEDLARRSGRPAIRTRVRCEALRVPPVQAWFDLWATLVHPVRNAVDHGFESPEERLARGKPAQGLLELRAELQEGRMVIEIEDDGRGVDWTRVEQKARALGLPCSTPEELHAALFSEGLSTACRVTLLSG